MMLTKHPVLEGKIPSAWMEPLNRVSGEETRFKLILDEHENELGAVSDRYTLVQMRDLISALDVAAGDAGLDLVPTKASYVNGKGTYTFEAPDHGYRVPGDPSDLRPTFILGNDYRGAGSVVGMSGVFRLVCTNGMTIGKVDTKIRQRHVGEIDVYAIVSDMVNGLVDRFEAERVMAEALAASRYHTTMPTREYAEQSTVHSSTLVDRIMADTPARYEGKLITADRENRQVMGDNLWALSQAVAEVSTHAMRGAAADAWATRQFNQIREHAGL